MSSGIRARSTCYNYTPFIRQTNHAASNCIDSASQFLLRQELFKKGADPYCGEPHRFWTWVHIIQNKVRNLNLSALDIITVLEANTVGKPQKLVQDFLAAGGANPDAALQKIWEALHERFGSGQELQTAYARNWKPSLFLKLYTEKSSKIY